MRLLLKLKKLKVLLGNISFKTHLETCAFVEIDCPKGCGQKYMKKNEQAHFEDDCIQVETKCEFCSASITKADEFNHLNVCKEFIVPCPNACGKTEMRRADVLITTLILLNENILI